ncbi:MAG: hypothetical protein HYS98_03095 [Deltaproteobacteria bacterium]|nr:hypothetical protein [Deltaproteobacteria bacterium]
MGKFATHYTDEELATIKEKWLKDKEQVDKEYEGQYHWDRDKAYEKYLNNANLRALFRFAAFLYKGIFETGDLKLFPNEHPKIIDAYRRVLANGYYDQSKIREKEVRRHFGNAVKRQYRPKNK